MINLVSILVPCFNHSSFVIETLDSFKLQSYGRISLHIIDDGSTDNSSELIERWLAKNSNRFEQCTFERTENRGVVLTLNSLLDLAKGSFVALCASDDILTVDSVALRVSALESDDSLDVVFGSAHLMNNIGVVYAHDAASLIFKANVVNLMSPALITELFYRWSLLGPVSMYRTNSLRAVGAFDVNYRVEDRSLFLSMVLNNKKYLYIDHCVAYYRRHDGASTINSIAKRLVQLDVAKCHVAYANKFNGLRFFYLKSFYLDFWALENETVLGKIVFFSVKAVRKLCVKFLLAFYKN